MPSIITYNVNGIRAALRKGLISWLRDTNPDILCLQEIKAKEEQFDKQLFHDLGYNAYLCPAQKPGYSGVAILTKQEPIDVTYGCGIPKIDYEGRVIRLDFKSFSVISVYFPSGSSGELRQAFKMEFLDLFQDYINNLLIQFPRLIISGDYNICHKSIDIHNPIRNKNTSGFLPEEREWLSNFLESGFVDSFRKVNQEPNQYSWWSYRANSRSKNLGWRIDYNMVSNLLSAEIKRAVILSAAKHSDHCPVLVEI